MNLPNFYASKGYEKLVIVPLLLLVAALVLIFVKGIPEGVDLKGGVLLTLQVEGPVDVNLLSSKVNEVGRVSSIRTFAGPSGTGVEIELENNEELFALEEKVKALQVKDGELRELEANASLATSEEEIRQLAQRQTQLNAEILSQASGVLATLGSGYEGSDGHAAVKKVVETYGNKQDSYRNSIIAAATGAANVKSYSFREVGPALSKFFLEKSREILAISFLLSAIAVLVVFRSLVPSVAVISGAVSDIVVTLGAMSLFGIPLTLASIAGLLMLIGFSLDTDVMLTMRVLKRREDTANQRAFSAFKTGSLMNLTSIGAFGILALAGLYLQIPIYFELGVVAVIGSIVDFAATWGLNAVLVLKYAEKLEAKTS